MTARQGEAMDGLLDKVQTAVLVLIPMILSLTVHEYAHARSAFALGDRTAAAMGRMTLNPLSHIDPFGTIFLPLLAIVGGGPFFGWARPVPINPVLFSRRIRMKTGILLTAAAGPASNLVLAFLIALGLTLARIADWSPPEPVFLLLLFTFKINVVLAVFNLIPIPPLDGSRVLAGLLPDALARQYAYLERNPIFVLLAFAVLITQAGAILQVPIRLVENVILALTGHGVS